MEINQVNNSQIIQNQNLETVNLGTTSKTKKLIYEESQSNDALSLNLSVGANKTQRSDYASSLSQVNDALAISQIAINGLDKQNEILRTIKDTLEKNNSVDIDEFQKNEIKTNVKDFVQQFNAISQYTKYQNQNLLKQSYEDQKIDLNVGEDSYSIQIPDTTKIGAELDYLLERLDFNPEEVGNMVGKVDAGLYQLEKFIQDFSQLKKNALESTQNFVAQENAKVQSDQKSKEINFGKETNDFTKSNVTNQMGYLLAAQANANQEVNIKLLAV